MSECAPPFGRRYGYALLLPAFASARARATGFAIRAHHQSGLVEVPLDLARTWCSPALLTAIAVHPGRTYTMVIGEGGAFIHALVSRCSERGPRTDPFEALFTACQPNPKDLP